MALLGVLCYLRVRHRRSTLCPAWLFAGRPESESSCSSPDAASGGHPPTAASPSTTPQPEWFVDRAVESGIDFVHVNGMSGQLYMPEILAPAWPFSTTTTTAISISI
jgi:hypothetical protein